MTGDRLYTLDEAARELATRQCAERGHAPSVSVGSYDRPPTWMCDCLTVTYTRKRS